MASVLALPCLACIGLALHPRGGGLSALLACGISLTFAVLVWAVRAATPMAALLGGITCLVITFGTQQGTSPFRSGLTPLIVLFLLTFAAGRAGRGRKERAGLAESRRGRTAAQVIANLGVAALIVTVAILLGSFGVDVPLAGPSLDVTSAMLLAALCEATADTVSSEIGQAFGGTPFLLTTLRAVPVGTDGAISATGTLAGVLASAAVAAAGLWALRLTPAMTLIAFAGGIAGLLFDSLLGATAERRGWLGNDLVNFTSTAFAAAVSLLLLLALRSR